MMMHAVDPHRLVVGIQRGEEALLFKDRADGHAIAHLEECPGHIGSARGDAGANDAHAVENDVAGADRRVDYFIGVVDREQVVSELIR